MDAGKRLVLGPYATISGNVLTIDLYACGTARDILRKYVHLVGDKAGLLAKLDVLDDLTNPQGSW